MKEGLRRGVVGLLVLAALGASPARAEETNLATEPALRPKFQRLASVRVSYLSGALDLLSASATLNAAAPFELEVGAWSFIAIGGFYARAGAGFTVLDNRQGADGRGFTLEIPALVGYRYITPTGPFGNDGTTQHGLTVDTGAEAVYWLAPHFGLEAQLTLGATFVVWASEPNLPPVWPDVRLALGLAF